MLKEIFTAVLYQPLYNLLIWFYNVIPGNDLGIAIIFLTIFVKILLYPLFTQSIKSQKALSEIQPKVDELNKKYKDQKDKLGLALMELYKKEKVNPFSSCLPLLIQLPFLIAVYQVFIHGLTNGSFDILYPFINNPGKINTLSLGIIDLAKKSVILAILAGIAQFWQTKMMISKQAIKSSNTLTANMNKQMIYLMPLITIFIGSSLPAGLTLYWLFTTILSAFQQLIIFKKTAKNIQTNENNLQKIN